MIEIIELPMLEEIIILVRVLNPNETEMNLNIRFQITSVFCQCLVLLRGFSFDRLNNTLPLHLTQYIHMPLT